MIILFCYFPSFNSALAGKEKFSNIDMSTDLPYYMRMSKKFRQRGRYNTYFSLLGSVMGTFITSGFFNNGRFVFEEIIFGCISGAIIISGCSTVCLSFWGSIIIGTTFMLFQNITHICPNCYGEISYKSFYPISSKGIYIYGL